MLTELQVKGAKPKDKPYMVRDDRGLYLRVDASGRKYWILRYWEQKKEHQISLGPYPEISLKDARLKRDEIQTARVPQLAIAAGYTDTDPTAALLGALRPRNNQH